MICSLNELNGTNGVVVDDYAGVRPWWTVADFVVLVFLKRDGCVQLSGFSRVASRVRTEGHCRKKGV